MISRLSHTVKSGALDSVDCESYFLFSIETSMGSGSRAFLYLLGIAYCFIGLSAITSRFFRSMENIVKHTRGVVVVDPETKARVVKHDNVWNFTIADITLLAFGTSFPQICLSIIDAIHNLGSLYAGGLGPGTLVGSAAFDLFPIHAVCVVVPKAGELKKITDIGVWLVELFWSFWAYVWLYIILKVWTPNVVTLEESVITVLQFFLLLLHAYVQDKRWPYLSLPFTKSERPLEWVPEEKKSSKHDTANEYSEIPRIDDIEERDIVDIFSVHTDGITAFLNKIGCTEDYDGDSFVRIVAVAYARFVSFTLSYIRFCEVAGPYQAVPTSEVNETSVEQGQRQTISEVAHFFSLWREQFQDALMLEDNETKKTSGICLRTGKVFWNLILLPWRFLFAFVPPYHIAHGWIAFISSLLFISGIAYVVTQLSDLFSCVTGINPYVIAFTALAAGTSWPDLVASKIAAERQTTADSAIANITCSNSVNIYVGIGIPWLIETTYNHFKYNEPLYIKNAAGLSFSLLVFFCTSVGCIGVLVLRRMTLGAELGGPRIWAWLTSAFFILLWLVFVTLSSLKVSGII